MKCIVFIQIFVLLFLFGCKQELKVKVTETHPNGAKKEEVYYYSKITDPRRIILYQPDGTIQSDRFMKLGMQDSSTTIYHPNGKVYKVSNFFFDKKGRKSLLNGKQIAYYDNGQLKEESYYEMNQPKGAALQFYKNGNKAAVTPYVNGAKNGEYMAWYEDGTIKEKIEYKDGNRNGKYITYYSNGNPKKEDTYNNNTLDGVSITYHENGQKENESIYIKGRLNGTKKEWNEKGKLVAEAEYENGVLTGGKRY